MKQNNPFVVVGYNGPEYFCDREKETAKFVAALENDRNVTLIAPRRYGKTGLIHHVQRQLSSECTGIYLDIFALKTFPSSPGPLLRLLWGRSIRLLKRLWRQSQSFSRVAVRPYCLKRTECPSSPLMSYRNRPKPQSRKRLNISRGVTAVPWSLLTSFSRYWSFLKQGRKLCFAVMCRTCRECGSYLPDPVIT